MTVSKVANALLPSARLRGGGTQLLDEFSTVNGGLWVGGRVTLTDTTLSFAPNGVNRALQTGVGSVKVPLRDIDTVTVLPGVFTKIIAIGAGGGVLKVRCYGAPAFAEVIRGAVRAAGGALP